MERFERYVLHRYPFRGYGPRKVPVIDECRHLKAKVPECLRYICDRGGKARRFDPAQAAFGLVPVGNGHFLTRGGRPERAAFEALLTRAPVEWELTGPPKTKSQPWRRSSAPINRRCRPSLSSSG